MTYLKLLEEQIDASDKFTRENFGLQVGDDFPEMVREVVKCEKLSMRLLLSMVTTSLSGKGIAQSLADMPGGKMPDFGEVVLKNHTVFETQLAMLYWGIQIGRKMEHESAAALNSLDEKS
jgi:hypothetical protein